MKLNMQVSIARLCSGSGLIMIYVVYNKLINKIKQRKLALFDKHCSIITLMNAFSFLFIYEHNNINECLDINQLTNLIT